MKQIKQIVLLLITMCFACNHDNMVNLFPVPQESSMDIKVTSVKIDTIILNDKNVESSQIGFSGISIGKQYYYFVDSRFCWYYMFDFDGNFLKRQLGQGQGPRETTVGKILTCCTLPDTSLLLAGSQLDYYLYDTDFNRKKEFLLLSEYGKNKEDNTIPSYENWAKYTHQYTNLICRATDNHKVFFNIYAEYQDFNYLDNTKDYLKHCYHILELDIDKEQTGKMYAKGYPPVYYSDPEKYVIFSGINFDVDNKNCFYVNYEADSLIYKYDNQYNPIHSFGYSGIDMDMNFKQISDYSDCRKYYRQERKEKGYYSWIEYVEETGLLFRSYSKGYTVSQAEDGLQIYSGTTLLADVSVPKGLKIVGYVAPYYYSQAIVDEEKELLLVYRFKFN